MSECFAFRLNTGAKRPFLVVFCSTEIFPDQIVKIIKADVEKNLLPSAVYLLGSASQTNVLHSLLGDQSIVDEIDSFVGTPEEKLLPIVYDSSGVLSFLRTGEDIPVELTKAILQQGMLEIFLRRKGLITSASNFHFLKPSGDHCQGFIRASNLLVHGEEVAFLALALLPLLASRPKRIYVDTSSISYLVCKAVLMSGQYVEDIPLIESYESYAAFKQSFDFVEASDSLVLISATTSGGLAASLLENTSFYVEQVVTLFHSALLKGQIGVFDVSPAVPTNVFSFKPDECPDCGRGSKVVKIVGDQFLPETPTYAQIVIKKSDCLPTRQPFIKAFSAKGLLRWREPLSASSESAEHFFIDVEKYLEARPADFLGELTRILKKNFSRDVARVISLDDLGSIALRKAVEESIGSEGILWERMSEVNEETLHDASSIVVVAGAITSGRKLLDASRRLRCINDSSTILYLVGFSKIPSTKVLEQLKKDLQLGGHTFIVLREHSLPRIISNSKSSWDLEEGFLIKFIDQFSDSPRDLPKLLETRLEKLGSNTGEANELFLPRASGENLVLRDTFAFWVGLDIDYVNATQADVYWTIQTILHDLRSKPSSGGLGDVYHTTVISPACFDRYNDGVIQACLLRSAHPSELNYSVDEAYSQQMTDVLSSIIESYDNDQGEAVLEFLMALCTGRLTIAKYHLKSLLEKFSGATMQDEVRFLLDELER